MEHVRVPRDSRAEVRVRGLLPLIFEGLAADAAEAHGGHAAGDDVEAGGDADDVEIVVGAVRQINAGFVEGDDGVLLDVDDVDVVAVELLEVGVLETGPLDAPVVRLVERGEDVLVLLVVEARALLRGPEGVGLLVGLRVEEVVLVVAEPVAEAAVEPELFVEFVSFFGRVVEGVSFREGVEEASEAVFAEVEEFRVPFLGHLLLFD